ICFIGKLGQRDRRISPDSGSLFQTIPKRSNVFRSIKAVTATISKLTRTIMAMARAKMAGLFTNGTKTSSVQVEN
ncbi:hypothetical protein LZL36_32515, partial [Pseudomonas aeruginosa]|nr:hypothetical protein [Pseudomonas aeruginosa]